MRMKKLLALALSGAMAFSLAACGGDTASSPSPSDSGSPSPSGDPAGDPVEISLWTYPVGQWGNQQAIESLIADFNAAYPDIVVNVELLDYTNGDQTVTGAIEGGTAPDLIFEGPERLVANWGAKGLMVDLSDLWAGGKASEIYESVASACKDASGAYYEFPVCMTAHTMAINRDMFEAAGALQYVDEETRTWTTENFVKAVEALVAYGQTNVGAVYCSGQGGDQGTRALVNNLYGGTFTNPEHTEYTANSPENIQALELLQNLEGINFDPSINGGEEIQLFCNKTLAMAFCWNVAQETNPDNQAIIDFNVLPMAFPTASGEPKLQGGIWGFGIFDNGDQAKIEAAKTFIKFMTEDDTQYAKAVTTSTYWPVRDIGNVYEGDEIMTEYGQFMQYMGDYYQVVPGWATARTEWWNMLQRIGAGGDVTTEVATFVTNANAAAAAG